MKPNLNSILALIVSVCAASVLIGGSAHGAWDIENSPTTVTLNDVWGASANEVFAVGAEETILHFNGTDWSLKQTQIDGANFHDVWGSTATNVLAVGDSGMILRYDGSEWKQEVSGTFVNLYGVWATPGGLAFAVGEVSTSIPYDAVILYYNGASWVTMASGSPVPLKAVWGTSASNVFAVGDNGTILRYDGSAWAPMNSATTSTDFRCVWGSAAGDVFAAGNTSAVYRYDGNAGNTWTETFSLVEYPHDLWGSSDNNVYAVGGSDAKTIYRYDGNSWTRDIFELPDILEPPEFPRGVWGSSRNDVFVVGDNGMIVRYTQVHVQSVSPFNGALNVPTDTAIRVTFSMDVDPGTLATDTFMLRGDAGAVSGSLNVNGSTVVFTPDTDLGYGKSYSATITSAVKDLDGNPLAADYRWSFETTRNVAQGASFLSQSIISTSALTAFSVYAADIDNDGDLDVLSASDEDDTVAWYENTDGSGTFAAPRIITDTAIGARSVFADDIDSDGDVDALSASWGVDNSGNNPNMAVAWYENAPDPEPLGSFVSQQAIAYHTAPVSVIAADLDNDGDLDVLSASYGDDTIAWYENLDGQGKSWTEHIITTLADGAWDVFAADLDNDGDLDVLSASNLNNDVAWYENRLSEASADFGPLVVITQTANGARVVRAADMDRDGDLDVISASWFDGKIAWYSNLGGTFGDPASNQNIIASASVFTQAMHVADLDNDGDVDVLYGSWRDDTGGTGEHKIVWMQNVNGSGSSWTSNDISTQVIGCQSLYTADLDGDGDLDVLSASQDDNKIAWYENKGPVDDVDSDGDGVLDSQDGCPLDPDKIAPGQCGCGETDTDADTDGVADCLDIYPGNPDNRPTQVSPADDFVIAAGMNVILESSGFQPTEDVSHLKTYWQVWRSDSGEMILDEYSTLDLTEKTLSSDLFIEGLQYVWRVGYEDSESLVPVWSLEQTFKIGTSIKDASVQLTSGTDLAAYKMVSFVQWPDDPRAESVFGDELSGNYEGNYRIGTYNADRGAYDEYGSGRLMVVPGRAYWFLAREGLGTVVDGVPVSLGTDVFLALDYNPDTQDGWNMVGSPNGADYLWGNVQVVVNDGQELMVAGSVQSLADDNPYIDRRLWRWENGNYASDTPDTDPSLKMAVHEGYWVKAKQANLLLRFDTGVQMSPLAGPDSLVGRTWPRASTLLSKLNVFSRAAMADNDTPPMPMGVLDGNTVDPVLQGCFVDSLEK